MLVCIAVEVHGVSLFNYRSPVEAFLRLCAARTHLFKPIVFQWPDLRIVQVCTLFNICLIVFLIDLLNVVLPVIH
jgi:hypothetical protein